ncbi:MAG: NADH-quinone oxidoreductase subunit A, partial [Syntrophales bacterium]|nr:NADH-quinone oxidoreductase subunit A [Syntrophales bacterium]
HGRVTDEPYESGMPPTGTSRINFHIKYYLVAMFFVIFDAEALFIYAWAVAARELGWSGYIAIVVFIGILLIALLYLAETGALDWGKPQHKR